MTAANGGQRKRDLPSRVSSSVALLGTSARDLPSRVSSSIALLGISAAALIALDLWHFTLATGVSALALAAFVAAYIVRQPGPRFGLYTFLVAEVSAISLGADLVTALTYQAFSVLLLAAIITPLPRIAKPRFYARPALLTLLIAAVALVPGLALVDGLGLTAVQAASLSGAILIVVSIMLIVVRQTTTLIWGSARA